MFATMFLAGVAVAFFEMPSEASCEKLVATMNADVAASAEENPYGLATNTGAIYRASDYNAACVDEKPTTGMP